MKNLTFYGIDVNLETSLFEYEIIVSNEKHEDNSGTQFCIYKIDENSFGTGHVSEEEINDLVKGNDWMKGRDIFSFLEYTGSDLDEWLTANLATKLQELISFFGYENIMGTEYAPITREEAEAQYLRVNI